MLVAPKWNLPALLICLCFLMPPAVFGQAEGNVLVNTDPQGSLVTLDGELSLSGVTPVKFNRMLSGQYHIRVARDGYETHKSTAYFSSTQFSQLDIELSPKTRFKSFIRSLVIPGWGQRYYGSDTKAAIYLIGFVGSAVGYAFAWDDYDSKKDTYDARKTDYESATQWGDLQYLQNRMLDAQREADDAETLLNIVRVAAISIYAINLFDTFFFFPEYSSFTEYKAITARPDFGIDRVGLTVSLAF